MKRKVGKSRVVYPFEFQPKEWSFVALLLSAKSDGMRVELADEGKRIARRILRRMDMSDRARERKARK